VSVILNNLQDTAHRYHRIGYSKKGWTNGEIGVEWIQEFDRHTKAKANGRYRLLLVDGHNSHYTRGFLEYARMHKILVLCYPAHTTHVLQGLDVVVFATVKRCLGEERDAWEQRTGEKISKTNFLGIYGRAHLRALTPENIKASFRKTGVWPFDPSVVTDEMMAPSKETSCEGHLPVVPATPVRVIAKLLQKLTISDNHLDVGEEDIDEGHGHSAQGVLDSDNDAEANGDGGEEIGRGADVGKQSEGEGGSSAEDRGEGGSSGPFDYIEAIKKAIDILSKGALAELVSAKPMTSTAELRHNSAHAPRSRLLNLVPTLSKSLRQPETRRFCSQLCKKQRPEKRH
jgi:hypothetical protein